MRESQDVEFKKNWRDEYMKTLCAFSNTNGGILYIGIDDYGNIVGVKKVKELLEKLATGIVGRRLTAPAIAFLESIKPLNFIGSQAMLFFRPIVGAIFPTSVYDKIEKILEKRCGIERLLSAIERVEAAKGQK